MILKFPWAQEPILWPFENSIQFLVRCKFLIDEVETISWESEAKYPKLFKSKLGHRKLLRKWFWSCVELRSECSERLKKTFFSFCKFLSDEVETVFWESETEPSRSIKFKVGHSKLYRKWLWSYHELKNECFARLKWTFFSFLQYLSEEVETIF